MATIKSTEPNKVNTMKQVIKANDLVYVPYITPNLVKAHNFLGKLQLAIGDTNYLINEHGQHYVAENESWNPQAFAFLATPEIQAKLEIVYGNLEDAPVDKELKKFEMMLEVLIEEVYDVVVNDLYNNDIDDIKAELVEMFNTRGEYLRMSYVANIVNS